MHQVLLVDEILQEIFEFCSEDGPATLRNVALCCRSWKDPALDILWRHMKTVRPLLDLIPGIACVDGVYVLDHAVSSHELASFQAYASRIKHITHRSNVHIHPRLLDLLDFPSTDRTAAPSSILLPHLVRVRLASADCDVLEGSLALSPQLRDLELDLGFRLITRTGATKAADAACRYLGHVTRVATGIERVSIRGLASDQLNRAVASMSRLRVLCLRIGSTLTVDTIVAVSKYPLLQELEIHAGHIDDDLFTQAFHNHSGTGTFSSLRKFHIRASISLIDTFVQKLPAGVLYSLHIEAENTSQISIPWTTLFDTLCAKACTSLEELTIENHLDLDDVDLGGTSDTPNATSITLRRDNHIQFHHLIPLSSLPNIRRFVLSTTLPPGFCDQRISRLVKWWPNLEHFDVGTFPDFDCVGQEWQSKMTLDSLATFATLPMLKSLIVPLNISCGNAIATQSAMRQTKLRLLSIGSTSPPKCPLLADYLNSLFPMLTSVDGNIEHEEAWERVRALLHRSKMQHLKGN